ncbi:MAG: 50S ribosomal protein L24 [Candidatus Gracilibacteria bacterium]|jgi:large subunit ribosomal protein L24
MKIHLDDKVMVIAGKYKGKSGKVMRTYPKAHRVVVEKINLITRHIKKKPNQPGQKIHYEGKIDVSNVIILCPHCEKPTRVSHIRLDSGKKQRVCKKCNQSLDKVVETKKTTKKR